MSGNRGNERRNEGCGGRLPSLTDYPVLFPLDGRRTRYRVSSGFGYRIHPLKDRRIFHKGVDLAAPYGEPVHSAGNGRVISAGYSPGYGRTVHIRHGGGYSTLYAHMSRTLVRKGETVRIGQRIGKVWKHGDVHRQPPAFRTAKKRPAAGPGGMVRQAVLNSYCLSII